MKHNYETAHTVEEAFADPLMHVGHIRRGYNRYKAFALGGEDKDAFFSPHHNVYGSIHMAVRWGIYRRNCGGNNPFDTKRFVLDLWNGQIVWQNFDDTKPTYKFNGIGDNYTTY